MPVVTTAENASMTRVLPARGPRRCDGSGQAEHPVRICHPDGEPAGPVWPHEFAAFATTYRHVDSPLGRIRLVGHDEVLTGLYLADHERCPPPDTRVGGRRAGLRAGPAAARRVLRRRLARSSRSPIDLEGSPFQVEVWTALLRHSLRCHRQLPRHRPGGRAAGRGSGRRRRQRPQPHLHHRSLPPRHRRRRQPHRLRLGRRPQGLAARPRARPQYHPLLGHVNSPG